MNRNHFLKSSLILGSTALVETTNAFSQNFISNEMDKLVDAEGNFVLQPLPYSEGFLEPFMDAETVHLHYTFHHGGAVKGANKDNLMIKKALDENNLDTVDFLTKKIVYN
jgi:Fe-Mn family superoxide dismutase